MGLFNSWNIKSSDYYWHRSDSGNFFILSDVNASFTSFMKKHELSGSVKDFKDKVRKSTPFTRIRTGSASYNYRSTPLYRVSDFKKK